MSKIRASLVEEQVEILCFSEDKLTTIILGILNLYIHNKCSFGNQYYIYAFFHKHNARFLFVNMCIFMHLCMYMYVQNLRTHASLAIDTFRTWSELWMTESEGSYFPTFNSLLSRGWDTQTMSTTTHIIIYYWKVSYLVYLNGIKIKCSSCIKTFLTAF